MLPPFLGRLLMSGYDFLQILFVHGERPLGHGVGVEASMDRLLAGLSELTSPL